MGIEDLMNFFYVFVQIAHQFLERETSYNKVRVLEKCSWIKMIIGNRKCFHMPLDKNAYIGNRKCSSYKHMHEEHILL